jgi:hypothetical protein
MAHLCTQADVEKFLQIAFGSIPEEVATYLIDGAEGLVQDEIGYDPTLEADLVEIHDPSHTFDLWVRRPPISAVNEIQIDGTVLPAEQYTFYLEDEDRSGLIRRIDGARWSSQLRGISVDYDAGYAFAPFPLRDACVKIVARAFEKGVGFAADGHLPGVTSVSLAGSDSISWSEAASDVAAGALELTMGELKMISRYKRNWVA